MPGSWWCNNLLMDLRTRGWVYKRAWCDFGPWRGSWEFGSFKSFGPRYLHWGSEWFLCSLAASFNEVFFPQVKLTDWKQVSKTLGTGSTTLCGLQRAVLSRVAYLREDQPRRKEQFVFNSPRSLCHRLLSAGPEMGLDLLRPFQPRKSWEL